MKRVLVTGASGFIGRHTTPALRGRGYEVHAVTSRMPGQSANGLIWHRANLLDTRELRALFEQVRPTHCVHLAWNVDPGAFWTSPENLRWVGASLDLLRSFVESGGKRVVMAGTCAEYAWGERDLSEAATPIVPTTLYGASKDAVHRVAARYLDQEKIELAWARVFYLYGPHEPPSRLVSSVTTALLRGEAPPLAFAASLRDYMNVSDVGDAFAAILDSSIQGAINIGSGEAVAARRIVELLGIECGRPDLVAPGSLSDRPGNPPRICADARRLRLELGWTPRVPLEQGLRATADWWKQQHAEQVRAGT